jgi:diaminopimelate decarboxylase
MSDFFYSKKKKPKISSGFHGSCGRISCFLLAILRDGTYCEKLWNHNLHIHRGEKMKEKQTGKIGRFTHQDLIGWAKKHGTPLYIYDADRITEKARRLVKAFQSRYDRVKLHYALKANTNLNLISLLKNEGIGAECISMGEMIMALKVGYHPEDILFTSSSKSPDELRFAVNHGVNINLDSMGDLENLSDLLDDMKKKINVSFRVNPDVDPKTHRHIATGHKFTKFGILLNGDEFYEAYRLAMEHPYMNPQGIHSHVGSQITDPKPMQKNALLLVDGVLRLKKELGLELKFIDIGGGLGIPYQEDQNEPDPEVLAEAVISTMHKACDGIMQVPELWLEPGRFFMGDAGILVARINSVKHTPHTNFINVNTGFNHQLRPILYEAYHRTVILGRTGPEKMYDIAGNICETGDILGEDRSLPTPETGDFLAILDTGAYGFSMASEYNSFLLPAEIMITGSQVHLIRKRAQFDDFLRSQIMLPGTLGGSSC